MRLLFDHTHGFGKMTHESFVYVPFAAEFEKDEMPDALEKGWLPFNSNLWYQARSTRISLDLYEPTKTVMKTVKKIKHYVTIKIDEKHRPNLERIYKAYLEHKNFTNTGLTIDDIIGNSNGLIYYVYDGEIVAFSCFKIVGNGFISVEFCWDYAKPSLELGKASIYIESLYAKRKGCKYLYLLGGYESTCLYKANFPGFEWWKGYEWSTDKKEYKKLCKRDDEVKIVNFE